MRRPRAGWALVAVALVTATSACAGGGTSDDVPPAAAPSSPATPAQPDAEHTALELAVLDALADDPHFKDVRYEADQDRVVVTVRTQGATLDADALRDLEERAEQVTDGVDVVVETTDEDVPTEE